VSKTNKKQQEMYQIIIMVNSYLTKTQFDYLITFRQYTALVAWSWLFDTHLKALPGKQTHR